MSPRSLRPHLRERAKAGRLPGSGSVLGGQARMGENPLCYLRRLLVRAVVQAILNFKIMLSRQIQKLCSLSKPCVTWVCFELEEEKRVLDIWNSSSGVSMHCLDLSLILWFYLFIYFWILVLKSLCFVFFFFSSEIKIPVYFWQSYLPPFCKVPYNTFLFLLSKALFVPENVKNPAYMANKSTEMLRVI